MTRNFPWCAVIGQERLKLSLLLCAIDPAVGGVLVRGPRGVAKTTLARAFAELLPGHFVELPLGATEEKVVGSLDLGKALGAGEVQFSPGLLARAHEGVLYVDEVNLLPDALVDLLLDASATGTNVIERDGISHVHAARFVLIGTMNPEEGELRPQLLDRFGLSVHADAVLTPADRAQIVQRRLEFERDPGAFMAAFESDTRALAERCAGARERLEALDFSGPGVARVAELCHAAGVDGVRADLAMLRAARAHAAWHGHEQILAADVDAVAELALAHRRRAGRGSPAPSGVGPSGATDPRARGSSAPAPGSRGAGASRGDSGEASSESARAREGDRGALPAAAVRARSVPALPEWLLSGERSASKPRGHVPAGRRRHGKRAARPGAIDWFGTLLQRPLPSPADVRRRTRKLRRELLWVVVLDCSASMLQSGAAGVAKGIAQAIGARASSAGARLALISFGGSGARRETHASTAGFEHVIGALPVGGGTPLRSALRLAREIERDPTFRKAAAETTCFLLTDARSRERFDDLGARFEPHALVVLDCELGALRLGRARSLAHTLGGTYLHIDALLTGDAPKHGPSLALLPEQERELRVP